MNIQFKTDYLEALLDTGISAEAHHRINAENERLRARITALETVEWVEWTHTTGFHVTKGRYHYEDCPWCKARRTVYDSGETEGGHAPDCPRGEIK